MIPLCIYTLEADLHKYYSTIPPDMDAETTEQIRICYRKDLIGKGYGEIGIVATIRSTNPLISS